VAELSPSGHSLSSTLFSFTSPRYCFPNSSLQPLQFFHDFNPFLETKPFAIGGGFDVITFLITLAKEVLLLARSDRKPHPCHKQLFLQLGRPSSIPPSVPLFILAFPLNRPFLLKLHSISIRIFSDPPSGTTIYAVSLSPQFPLFLPI